MNIICITHADFETPGIIEKWALKNKHTFNIVKPYRGETVSNEDDFDFLIVMGGPQSASKIDVLPSKGSIQSRFYLHKNAHHIHEAGID